MNSEVECPLCTQIGFQSVDALRTALVSAASRNLICPVCNASLTGLDKLTIHLFGHTIPQHELQNVGQSVRINNNIPTIDTSETQSSVPKPITLITQEPISKTEVISPCTIPLQNLVSFQNEAICNKVSETMSVLNQDLSNLLCWLPVTCLPEKLPTPSLNSNSLVNCDLNSRTSSQSEQNEGKIDNRHLLGTIENTPTNKDPSFIFLSLPSLQDFKKQCDYRGISNSTSSDTNELNLLDISSLSGKLLMLDCSGNSQSNSNVSVNNSLEQSDVQISLPQERTSPHTSCVKLIPPNQNSSLPNREVANTAISSNIKDDNVEQNKQSGSFNVEVAAESTKSSMDVFRCTMCFSQFTDSNILSLHQQLVHDGAHSLQSRQTTSDKNSTSKQEVGPVESNEGDSYQCHLCSKTFHMQGSLMVHLRVAHTAPTMVGLVSRIKGNILDEPSTSAVSTINASSAKLMKDQPPGKGNDNKQWECSDCGKFFTTKYFLKKHKRLHTGEMPYSCPTCRKSFTFQQSYHKHLLYHSDEKPYTCTECGRAFKEISTLHNHQRIHTGEKPWACETCGKCFRQRVSYLVHRRIHTGAMPYCCTVCNKSFRYKVSQRTHKCIAQSSSATTRQSGDLLQRLLFDQSEEKVRSQENRIEQSELEKLPQLEQTPFIQKQPEEVQTASGIGHSKTTEPGSQLLFSSLNDDKSIFTQTLEPNTSDFSLHNFELQQTLSNIQNPNTISQNNAVLQNAHLSSKDELKQTAVSEKGPPNSAWCSDKGTSPGQNSSSLVVIVNDKEMISTDLSGSNIPVSLLQVLQKEKYNHASEFPPHPSLSTNNNQPSTPLFSESVKVGNTVLSSQFVPDFLSMAMSAPIQNHVPITGNSNSNDPIGDPFQWDVSLDIPSHDHNDSITDNVSASQETMDSLQSLLFGSPSTEL